MNKQEQIKEMKKIIGNVKPFYVETIVEALYNAGYRKTFTSDLASDTQKAFKEGYEKGCETCEQAWEKQAKIDALNELKKKTYVNDYCREVVEIEKIDELLKEYEE